MVLLENLELGLFENRGFGLVSVKEESEDVSEVGSCREVVAVLQSSLPVLDIGINLLCVEGKSLESHTSIDSLLPVVAYLLEESSDLDVGLVAVGHGGIVILGGDLELENGLWNLKIEESSESGFDSSNKLVNRLVALSLAGDNGVIPNCGQESLNEIPEISEEVSIVFSERLKVGELTKILNKVLDSNALNLWASLEFGSHSRE